MKYNNETQKGVLKRYENRNRLKKKLSIRIVLSLFLLILSCVALHFGLNRQSSYSITKIEKGLTDYLVYLNKDDIYNKEYQKSGFSYVSSTIDYIKTKFNYELKFDEKVETMYDYEIKSILTIKEKGVDGKVLYTDEYQELEKVTDLPITKDVFINEDIKIDYKKYNLYVENYKKTYGVSVDANLKTVMYIKEKSTFNEKEIFNEVRELSVTIPLGEHTLSINVNNPIDSIVKLNGDKELNYNILILIPSFILIAFTIILTIKNIKLLIKYEKLKTKYDIKLEKILKGYDRIIVKTDITKINQNFKNIISINEFEELVDVRDNTEQPILYVERKVGMKSEFMVINGETLYVYDFDIENLK